jgi:pyridoxal phosphate enzyme (YggS family)
MNPDADDAGVEGGTRLAAVRERIAAAARGAGRAGDDVVLVAVSKEQPVAAVEAALAQGQRAFGENRAQELLAKAAAVGSAPLDWHFVGRLQRNKVRALAPHVILWHSIDRAEVGVEVARCAPGARVLVQVNLGDEPQKGGCAPDAAGALVDNLRTHGLDVAGLMTVPPAADDPRPHFATLRELALRLGVRELSMGMTNDFEVAIDEGATIVRVGSAVFGARHGRAGLRR